MAKKIGMGFRPPRLSENRYCCVFRGSVRRLCDGRKSSDRGNHNSLQGSIGHESSLSEAEIAALPRVKQELVEPPGAQNRSGR